MTTAENRPAASRRRFHVFVNEAAGSVEDVARQSAEIEQAFADSAVDVTVAAIDPAGLADAIRTTWESGDLDAIVVAGGDGTISCAAGAAVSAGAVLGVLPLGTFNHFAKDLGVPTAVPDAVAYLAAAPIDAVDVGEINGHVFVNNAAIGVYPEMVTLRDVIRERRGWGKVRAVPAAMVQTLRRMPTRHLRITLDDGSRLAVNTAFLFVGNGLFDADGTGVGTRTSLGGGRLGIYVIATTSRWRLVREAVRARLRGIDAAPQTDRREATTALVECDEREVAVALDGEPMSFEAPLRFRIRPRDLRVLRATDAGATGGSGRGTGDEVPTVAH